MEDLRQQVIEDTFRLRNERNDICYEREKLKAEVGDKAKSKVSGYSEQKLRETLEKILDNCIDACSIVLDE